MSPSRKPAAAHRPWRRLVGGGRSQGCGWGDIALLRVCVTGCRGGEIGAAVESFVGIDGAGAAAEAAVSVWPVTCHPDRPSLVLSVSSIWASRLADNLGAAMILIQTVAGAPAPRTVGVGECLRHNGDPIVWVVPCIPVARPNKFGAILLAEPLMFLQYQFAVIRQTVF